MLDKCSTKELIKMSSYQWTEGFVRDVDIGETTKVTVDKVRRQKEGGDAYEIKS